MPSPTPLSTPPLVFSCLYTGTARTRTTSFERKWQPSYHPRSRTQTSIGLFFFFKHTARYPRVPSPRLFSFPFSLPRLLLVVSPPPFGTLGGAVLPAHVSRILFLIFIFFREEPDRRVWTACSSPLSPFEEQGPGPYKGAAAAAAAAASAFFEASLFRLQAFASSPLPLPSGEGRWRAAGDCGQRILRFQPLSFSATWNGARDEQSWTAPGGGSAPATKKLAQRARVGRGV